MNNKGFAITTILYGILIIFLMLLLSMLGMLATYKDRLSILIESNNGARCIINGNCNNTKKYLHEVAVSGNYVSYQDNNWVVLYNENNYVYIVSPDIPINNIDFYTIEGGSLTNYLLPYCDTSYVDNGVCEENNTMLTLNNNNFQKFILQYYGVEVSLYDCYQSFQNENCGFNNHVIDIDDSYWFNNNYNGQFSYYYWDTDNRYINAAGPSADGIYGIRPVIKLANSVLVTNGDGTFDDPFLISPEIS